MPARPPNFRLIALIASGTFNTLGALWIFADARARGARKPLFAALAMLLLGPLWLAFYMTDRPLRAHERRSGGFGFTWTRHFATAWTASLVPWLAAFIFLFAAELPTGSAGSASLVVVDPRFPLALWLVPVAAAIAIGYGIRRPDAIEIGGPAPASTRIPLAVVSLLAAFLTFVLLTSAKGLL
jgi:hypothetical protein